MTLKPFVGFIRPCYTFYNSDSNVLSTSGLNTHMVIAYVLLYNVLSYILLEDDIQLYSIIIS